MHYKEYKHLLSPKNGMNIYRGCSHGCIYCDSRSKVYEMDHLFEDIEVKKNAPAMLDLELSRKRKPCMIGTGAMSDPFCSAEDTTHYTKECLDIIYKHSCGVTLLTKSAKVLNVLDILKKINERAKSIVQMTLTTADDDLCRIIEPNVSTTKERFEALKTLRDNSIETVVWFTPILPFINDTFENVKGIMDMCVEARVYGVIIFGVGVTLREGNREYFYSKLDKHFPNLKDKYIKTYGNAYELSSPNGKELYEYIISRCKEAGIEYRIDKIFEHLNYLPEKNRQLSLFDL